MSIYLERKDKGWRVKVIWYENGRQHTKSKQGFATKALARKYGVELENQQNKGVNIGSNPWFNDYFKEWCEIYVKPKVSTITYQSYSHDIKVVNESFSNTKIKDVTRIQYQRFINQFAKDHVTSSVKKLNNHIRACVRSAILDGLITIDFTQNITTKGDDTRQYQVDYLNLDEIKRLLDYCISNRDSKKSGYYVIIAAILTGARLGEILGLEWASLSKDTMQIKQSWNYKLGKLAPTKNVYSNRSISIPPRLYNLLQERSDNRSDLVFMNSQGMPNTKTMNALLRRCLSDLNINRPGFHFHSLRHSHVAYLISQGFDIYTISKRLGHADTTITSRTYAYLLDEYKKETDDRLRKSLSEL